MSQEIKGNHLYVWITSFGQVFFDLVKSSLKSSDFCHVTQVHTSATSSLKVLVSKINCIVTIQWCQHLPFHKTTVLDISIIRKIIMMGWFIINLICNKMEWKYWNKVRENIHLSLHFIQTHFLKTAHSFTIALSVLSWVHAGIYRIHY